MNYSENGVMALIGIIEMQRNRAQSEHAAAMAEKAMMQDEINALKAEIEALKQPKKK